MNTTLRFVGHTGEITSIARLPPKSMFVLDANTVIAFLRHADKGVRLEEPHFRLLRETRRRVHIETTRRSSRIPLEPVLALMELTRQDRQPDFSAYLDRFTEFFRVVYGLRDLDSAWVRSVYEPVSKLLDSVHHSIRQTLEKILAAAPAVGTLSRDEILARVDAFLAWIVAERRNLAVVGGPLLQLAIYAIAGSPTAHRFLKLQRVAREGCEAVARNVAWDVLHWVNLEFHYHYAKYAATVVCTSDQALADFLLIRQNLGPRVGREELAQATVVNSYGRFSVQKLSRLDDSVLGDEIAHRLSQFWNQLQNEPAEEVWFTPLDR